MITLSELFRKYPRLNFRSMMADSSFTRSEVVGLVVRLSLLSAVTFFSIKWMLDRIDPTSKSSKLTRKRGEENLKKLLKSKNKINMDKLSMYEMMIAAHIIDPQDIKESWENIGGLESTIRELREKVILPIHRRDLFADSRLTQPPKGVLLHGPPGCGKTLISKATAKEAGTWFINLDVSILTDKWYGESQKLAAAVFSLAVKLQPCIIFIDEIDSFLRVRNSTDHEATAMMKAQFMSFWDGLITNPDCTVIIMGATNRPQDLDAAILRRMPATFHIPMPNATQRKQILDLILNNEPIDIDVNVERLAHLTTGFSGSDLREMCRDASIYRVGDYMRVHDYSIGSLEAGGASSRDDGAAGGGDSGDEFHDALRHISMADFLDAVRKIKDSKVLCGLLPSEISQD